jgi:hypothetical protein
MLPSPRRGPFAALLLAAALTAACEDLPTGPQVWTRDAAGRRWVAVAEPVGLPSARGWLAWTASGDSVRGLLSLAARERRAGRLENALSGEAEAAELAARTLGEVPTGVVLSGLASVDSWVERAAEPAESGTFAELQQDLEAVRALADESRAALATGDRSTACLQMTRAANLARQWTPMAVAARAVVQAELAISRDPDPSAELLRARRLLRGAREGVASGDHARALQRALYALQIIEHEGGR